MAVTAKVEQNSLGLAFGLAPQCLDDRAFHGMVGFGCGHDALGPGEQHTGLETSDLVVSGGLEQAELVQVADHRRHAVVAQTASVESRWREGAAQRVHLGQRRHVAGVAEVIGVLAARQAGAGGGFDRDDAAFLATAQLLAYEREGDAGEVAAAAGAADDHIGVVAGHLHLQHGFLADDGLVHQHMVEHRAQRVLGVVMGRGDLDRLADRNAQRSRVVRARGEHTAAVLGLV